MIAAAALRIWILLTIVTDETSFDLTRVRIAPHTVNVGVVARRKGGQADWLSRAVLVALHMAAALTSLTLSAYVLQHYGGEGLSCRIARGLFALEFFCLFISHPSRPILEAKDELAIFASTARAVHSLIERQILGIDPIRLLKLFAVGQFPLYRQ